MVKCDIGYTARQQARPYCLATVHSCFVKYSFLVQSSLCRICGQASPVGGACLCQRCTLFPANDRTLQHCTMHAAPKARNSLPKSDCAACLRVHQWCQVQLAMRMLSSYHGWTCKAAVQGKAHAAYPWLCRSICRAVDSELGEQVSRSCTVQATDPTRQVDTLQLCLHASCCVLRATARVHCVPCRCASGCR